MPLFEYKCAKGHTFEKLVRSGAPTPLLLCQRCVEENAARRSLFLQIASVDHLMAELQTFARTSPFTWGKAGSWN